MYDCLFSFTFNIETDKIYIMEISFEPDYWWRLQMKHLFFFFHIIAFSAGIICTGFTIFIYNIKKDVRLKYFFFVLVAYMLILLEQTISSYSLVNSIGNANINSLTRFISGIGCGLTIYYLPVFAGSFTNKEETKNLNLIAKGLTIGFAITVVLYYSSSVKGISSIVGNSILIVAIVYSLVILVGYSKSGIDSEKSKMIRRFFLLTLLFLPYMLLDMRIENISGIGQHFPYGIFSVPMFLVALSVMVLYYGYKEFKTLFINEKSEDKIQTNRELKEDINGAPSNIEKFYDTYNITKREREIIELLTKGYSYNRISEELFVALPTVKSHVYNIYQKTGVKSKIELINLINTTKSY